MTKRKTARQIAASRRNIVKAQQESARSRRGKKRSAKAGHHHGTGRKGRRATKRALYGSRRHGISPAQQQRRKYRSNKRWRRAGYASTAVSLAYAVHGTLSPAQKKKLATKSHDYAENVRVGARGAKMTYKINRQMGNNRRRSAKASVPRPNRKR